MRLGLHVSHSYWSRAISLETIGMPSSAFLLAPARSQPAATTLPQSRAVEGLQIIEAAQPVRQASTAFQRGMGGVKK